MGRGRMRRSFVVLGGLLVLVSLVALLGVATGDRWIPLGELSRIVLNRFPWVSLGEADPAHEQIVWVARMPRVLLGLLVGFALSVCGGVMQGVFRNPLADPYLLGIASGATAGAAALIALGYDTKPFAVSIGALSGGLLAVAIVYRLSLTRLGRLSDYTLILAGIAITALFGSVTSFLIYFAEGDDLRKIIFWMLGSLDVRTVEPLLAPFLVVLSGALVIQLFSRDLNALMLGDDMAMHLGVDPQFLKKILLFLAAVMTATVVSQAGVIGFVGLIIPHAVRLVLGPDHRLLLPAAGITGAGFLVLCDAAARTVASPHDLPVGIITSIFGAPFLIYLLRRPRARGIPGAARGDGS